MTDVDICNVALGKLSKGAITSFDGETEEARQAERLYATCRDAVLGERLWSFAKARIEPDRASAAAPFPWTYAFDLPANVLAVHGVDDGSNTWEVGYEVVGRQVLTDAATLHLLVKVQMEDTSVFSPGFNLLLATRLAAEMAIPLTANRQLMADLWAEYEAKLRTTGAGDGLQGRTESTRRSRIARFR